MNWNILNHLCDSCSVKKNFSIKIKSKIINFRQFSKNIQGFLTERTILRTAKDFGPVFRVVCPQLHRFRSGETGTLTPSRFGHLGV